MGLQGTDVSMSLINQVESVTDMTKGQVCTVPLTYVIGKEWMIEAVELNEFTSKVTKVDVPEMAANLGVHA